MGQEDRSSLQEPGLGTWVGAPPSGQACGLFGGKIAFQLWMQFLKSWHKRGENVLIHVPLLGEPPHAAAPVPRQGPCSTLRPSHPAQPCRVAGSFLSSGALGRGGEAQAWSEL